MKIKDFFTKDINRNIETVIKADDQDHVLDEVTEYVVTKEVEKKIKDFFSAYNDYRGANGVWISGFFGSGKSHLLKILSYVLENKEYNGYHLGELFAEKIEGDQMLKGDIQNATRHPSESILFNIDQQAQITSKTEEDALLNVFYKVYNDHLGYFGAQRHVAEFECWLDEEGHFKQFREEYKEATREFWSDARRKWFAPAVKENIGLVLSKILGNSPEEYKGIIDTLRKDSKISVEDFCTKVQEYIKTKPNGFRLNFFVDEVGQYISDNTKLMLNLQTIAETLATKTKGNSWILVTSQEDMERVVGDMNKSQQNDFSRIQARFKLKIPLTSANVDEVIEKRLLEKTDSGKQELSSIWNKDRSNMETILSFDEIGLQFKGYRNEKDFVNKYPFVAYQFDLFQECIRALSNHNAFQGKHASVGERSMLGVFQNVVQQIEEKDADALVSFDQLFEGIRSTIRGEIQSSITLAENNLDDNFAIKVLKALFMVKYYSNFKTTIRNVSTMMIDNIHIDLKEHDENIQKALNILEQQTYIQRNGELFEFLTDDEKDIEKEIKNTDIDDSQITQLFKEIIFDEIIRDSKIRFIDNKQEYEFTSKIDGSILGREKELTIEVITSNFPDHDRQEFFTSQTMGYNTLLMCVLPNDDRLLMDVRMLLKTDKYVKQSQSTTNKDNVKRILYEKQQQNSERRKTLVLHLRKLLGEADVYMNGTKQEMPPSSDGKNKIVNAFQNLIKLAYPSLQMLGKYSYSEETVKNIIRNLQDDLFGADDSTISEAESEILNIIIRRKNQSDRTSLSDLRDHFTKKPYGWYPNAIWSVTGKLFKRGKVELRQESNLIIKEESALEAFLNNRYHGITLLEPQEDIDPKYTRALIEVYNELFDETCSKKEAKDVGLGFKDKLNSEFASINQLLMNQSEYPFLKELQPVADHIESLSKKEYSYFLKNMKDFEDTLLDYKENLLDPIRIFWNGEQKRIYDSIRGFINGNQSNLEYIEGDDLKVLQEVYNHPKPYTGSIIRDAKASKENLTEKVLEQIDSEKKLALQSIYEILDTLRTNDDYETLSSAEQNQVLRPIEDIKSRVEDQRYIANIRQAQSDARAKLPLQLNEIYRLKSKSKEGDTVKEPKPHYVRNSSIQVNYNKKELKTVDDVQEYLKALEDALKELIKNNKRILLK